MRQAALRARETAEAELKLEAARKRGAEQRAVELAERHLGRRPPPAGDAFDGGGDGDNGGCNGDGDGK